MDPLSAIEMIEDTPEWTSHDDYLAAWQSLIDSGAVWSLQGYYGRTATELIRYGHCRPPTDRNRS